MTTGTNTCCLSPTTEPASPTRPSAITPRRSRSDPRSPWVRFSRARLFRARYAWDLALEDLRLALEAFRAEHRPEEQRTRLELGLVHQSLGDQAAARADYDRVIAADPGGRLREGRAA